MAPPEAGSLGGASVSVTVLVGRLAGSLQDYGQVYLADKTLTSSRPESRQGAQGMSYSYGSPGGQKRHRLLLLEEAGSVYGLYAEGDAQRFERETPVLEAMFASFALERPAAYALHRDEPGGFAIRLPPSWASGRSLSSGGRRVAQFLSPPLRADRPGQTVHASLTVSVEAPRKADPTHTTRRRVRAAVLPDPRPGEVEGRLRRRATAPKWRPRSGATTVSGSARLLARLEARRTFQES